MTDEVSATLEIFPPDGSDGLLRQIGIGIQPLILIEPVAGEEEGDVEFKITASLLDQEELTQVIGFLHRLLTQDEADDTE